MRVVLAVLLVSLLVVPLTQTAAANHGPTVEEVRAAIAQGVEWLAAQQDDDGFWGIWELGKDNALADDERG